MDRLHPSGFAMTAKGVCGTPQARSQAPWPSWRVPTARSHLQVVLRFLAVLTLGVGATLANFANARMAVDVPSLDAPQGQAVVMPSHWFASPRVSDGAKAPAMVLLHGCAGIYTSRDRQLVVRMREYADLLNRWGIHVLVTDSLSPRGEKELCTQREAGRKVTQSQRRRDALGALQWLAQQPGVDAQRLGLMGWSNGGSTVLAATNAMHHEVAQASVQPALAVLYYPGCWADLRAGYHPVAPALMQVGELDDWTPAEHCLRLADQIAARAGPKIEVQAYADAHHGFDGSGPVVHRKDVPNGKYPGSGVHVGGQPQARAASMQRLEEFLRAQWKLPP